jgi:hypothetical protein
VSNAIANAAADRITQIVQIPAITRPVTGALEFVRHALESDVANQLSHVELNSFLFWYGDDMDPVLRFVSFAGLVELAVHSGYLHLFKWEGAKSLAQAIGQFLSVNESSKAVDLHLVRALHRRFDTPPSGSWSLDETSLGSFESYLTLTRRIRGDREVRAFLAAGFDDAIPGGDWSVLLSLRHFAESFGTGTIDGVPVTDVAAGYRLLGYLEWLSDILEAVREDQDLRSGIVRHARWAAHAERIRDRFRVWVERMREWEIEGGESSWRDDQWYLYEIEVFGMLLDEQDRQASMVKQKEDPTTTQSTSAPLAEEFDLPSEQSVEQLLAEGRFRAARELALAHAIEASRGAPGLAVAAWSNWAEQLVARCLTLASLGGETAASAIVAPIIPRLVERHGKSGWKFVADALELVNRARRDAEVFVEGAQDALHAPADVTRRPETEVRVPRHRNIGESS